MQQYHKIRQLCIANCLVVRKQTHQSQCRTEEDMLEAKEWLTEICLILSQPAINRTYVINMDQTSVPFSYASNYTLDTEGKKTIV